MATFNVVTGEKRDKLFKLQSLCNTQEMKDMMTALARVNKNDTNPKAGNWTSFKTAFENFGYTVVYDRNMAILITALFAAIAQSGCSKLLQWAKKAITTTTPATIKHKNVKKGENINLGTALLNGDGKAVYKILVQSQIRNMLGNIIGIDNKCVVKFLNRVKKITPWRLSGSKRVLKNIKTAFEKMTNENYDIATQVDKKNRGNQMHPTLPPAPKAQKPPAATPKTPATPPPATPKTQGDPGIFKGLPNGENYCYLNTALQELYALPNFRKKVLECDTSKIDVSKIDKYKELIATNFFFVYLSEKDVDVEDFENMREEMARYLGYDGSMGNSYHAKKMIESLCRDQLKQLKNKETTSEVSPPEIAKSTEVQYSRYKTYFDKINPDMDEDTRNKAIPLLQLYEDKLIKEQILSLTNDDLFLISGLEELEDMRSIFDKIANNKYDEELKKLVLKHAKKDWSYDGLKNLIKNSLTYVNRSKRSRFLYGDSTIIVNSPHESVLYSLKQYFSTHSKFGKKFLFALKNNRFSVTFSDDQRPRGIDFSVEEELNLENLVKDNILTIFVRDKSQNGKATRQLNPEECKFKLILASIGTGVHYYVYKKIGENWKKFNDSSVEECYEFSKIQDDISKQCESLTYELDT